MYGKLEFGSDSVFENGTIQKSNVRSDGFLIETACNLPFKYKVNKSNFTCIKCADKERFKTRPKHIDSI